MKSNKANLLQDGIWGPTGLHVRPTVDITFLRGVKACRAPLSLSETYYSPTPPGWRQATRAKRAKDIALQDLS